AALEPLVVRRDDFGLAASPSVDPRRPIRDDGLAARSPAERKALAQNYVDSDGTSSHLLASLAFRKLPATERKAMHLARADQLTKLDEPSLRLGAIPYHHAQAGEGAEVLLTASRLCLEMACYDAALDWSLRGRKMLSDAPQGKVYDDLTRNL